jgi:hypothetical protein
MCLSLNNCKLESLENFPTVPTLIRLEIMDNTFPASDLKHLSALTSLQSLSLANNDISEFSQLEPLKNIPNLVQLDLSECKISEKEDYRKKVFAMLEKLHILDNMDEEGKPFEYSGESEAEGEGAEEEEDDDEEDDFQVDAEKMNEDDQEDEDADEEAEVPEEHQNGTGPVDNDNVAPLKKTKIE